MTLLKEAIQEHLTPAPHDRAARATWPGMAHWAGSGPKLTACRGCSFWDHQRNYHPARGKYGGLIKAAPCRKFCQLTGDAGDKIPDDAPSCKHFAAAETVPDRFAKK